jgi:hypothetical protein
MGVLEVVVVLKAVFDQAIEADVGERDQAERDDQGLVLPPADGDDRRRQRRAVAKVVEIEAETGAARGSRSSLGREATT